MIDLAEKFSNENELVLYANKTINLLLNYFINTNENIDKIISKFTRPKWSFKKSFIPILHRSIEAGNYEYEIMVFRKKIRYIDTIFE